MAEEPRLKVGDEHVSAVVPAENRIYAQVDNTLLAVIPYPTPQVQLTFLSIRVRYHQQTISVTDVDPTGLIQGTAPQYSGEAETVDIGGFRMLPDVALDLGIGLVVQALQSGAPMEIVRQKFASAGWQIG